jgi:hypothetical protein
MKYSNQKFKKAVCSLSVTGPLILTCWFKYAPQFTHFDLEESLKGTSGRLWAEGMGDAMSKPVIITTFMRVGVIRLWSNKKQFKA